jgi:hypothetical protein
MWFTPLLQGSALSAVSVQLLRPTSDITTGTWTPSTGASLFGVLDETPFDDADFITTSASSICEVKYSAGTDPVSSTGHIIRYRAKGTSGTLTVSLYQGATLIATQTPTLTTSYQTFTMTLSSGEANSITDYTDLRLRFVSA